MHAAAGAEGFIGRKPATDMERSAMEVARLRTKGRNPTRHSHIVGYTSHFYAHIGAGPKVFHPLMSRLMWV